MTIAGGIFLIAVGAILKFATNARVAHINLDTVGIILMIAGAAGLILGFIADGRRRRSQREVFVEDRREPPPPQY